ncbi:hypothetical protein E2562_033710 [Oryza meyeriana var. granulata]|uniref:Uncharacterized protein n=1 Tax=Oryza meyeriana var. granulata TaxID=110450 RepID=A0A6G1DRS6_9ORYZ|nr:hypothetical protein E2562_033710 [Oryza meyeriana var. granulata]
MPGVGGRPGDWRTGRVSHSQRPGLAQQRGPRPRASEQGQASTLRFGQRSARCSLRLLTTSLQSPIRDRIGGASPDRRCRVAWRAAANVRDSCVEGLRPTGTGRARAARRSGFRVIRRAPAADTERRVPKKLDGELII